MKAYINFMDTLNTGLRYIVSTLFVIMVSLVFLQVLTRFVINYPISWTEEISRYLMIYIVFLGSALLVRRSAHIAVDFLLEIVKPKTKGILDIIILIASIIFFAILLIFGIQLTFVVIGQVTPNLQFSMAWAYAAVPVGALLMFLNALAVLFEKMQNRGHKGEEQLT
ncbi:TRAP transporter small permease [Salinicoccus sp. ID82-1]|uniref:TRAP transporter small permease n=1 Tax=Salinicoccus sp. ID82-1 TaxID=2820269 RepID=UPI001F27EA56|nr:TRAP transporter small permease [Salinicoccus sp. ID82-1]MCG1008837.1 TRAP transporter small permease [Salinicoccus sp. ID82-1]